MERPLRFLLFLVASVILYELISGVYIWLGSDFTEFYQFNILFHTFIGIVFFLPFSLYQYIHYRRAQPSWKGGSRFTGYAAFVVVFVVALTGLHLTIRGQSADAYLMADLHLWVGLAGTLLIILHVFMRSRNHGWSFAKSFGINAKGGILWLGGFTVAIFLAQILTVLLYKDVKFSETIPASYSLGPDGSPFAPSEVSTESGGLLDARALGDSVSCAQGGCHADIYEQWYASAHRYSSTDVFYRKVEAFMIEDQGTEATRYCGGCHDPVALLSGALTPGEGPDSAYSDEGSSCLVCHSISDVRHLKGSGSYVIRPARRYLFAHRKNGIAKALNRILVRSVPDLHKAEYTRSFYDNPEFCATCHKQYIKDPTNDWGWVKLQDQYGEWLESPFSGRNDKGFNKETVKLCRDCHMPLVASNDPAAGEDGMIRSHRFIAANSAIPWLDGDMEQYELTREWLKGRKLLVDVYIPRDKDAARNRSFVPNEIFELSEPALYVTLGEQVDLTVAVTNAQVGHSFPNGPLDIYESWLEVKVVDGQNSVIYHSGSLSGDGHVEVENTRFFLTIGLNKEGTLIDRHNLWNIVGNGYRKLIPSGQTDMSVHTFEVPYWAKGDITVMARVRYRRFNKDFTNWLFDGQDVRLPIVDLARTTRSVPIRNRPEKEETAAPLLDSGDGETS